MKFASIIALLTAPFAISATRVSWDSVYDQGTQSLSTVECSDGSNGLLTKGFNVFKDLPTFPNIGGSSEVASWNSPNCGSSHPTELDLEAEIIYSPCNRYLLERHLSGRDDHTDGDRSCGRRFQPFRGSNEHADVCRSLVIPFPLICLLTHTVATVKPSS